MPTTIDPAKRRLPIAASEPLKLPDTPVLSNDKTGVARGPDEVEGAFLDWRDILPKRTGKLTDGDRAHARGVHEATVFDWPSNGGPVPGPDGHPTHIYGQPTGWGMLRPGAPLRLRLAWLLGAPWRWLLRVLVVAWVCVTPHPSQVRTKRQRARVLWVQNPSLLPSSHAEAPKPQATIIVPVLVEWLVRLIPKWALHFAAARRWLYPVAPRGITGLQVVRARLFDEVTGDDVIAVSSSDVRATVQGVVTKGAWIEPRDGERK